ncbi:low molecular weight protein-tyrosine-phosphatase [Suipraeoptans intestinalis]|uniref:low molecular weight protein-tyrosine-phosphatase n=1 Tax=Suipraeoptans intestinalis TaxID=2606628 RepID=UPI0023F54582|nr:low molecular weight protein-tyrosine-phosphatase [Suipraeoptans intestinalis]MDD7769711.1 low molecular weight phosphotyrosine protein phosphatase [Suipraeoptans intestinalis]
MIKVLFICHGNICRSTMAESLFTHMVKEAGREEEFLIASAGTSREEIGNPPHRGTVKKLKEMGVPVVPHRAVQMTAKDVEEYDYLIGMDRFNLRNMERIADGKKEKLRTLLSFAGSEEDIADPWYTGDFDRTYEDIQKGLQAFLKTIEE